MGCGAEPHVRIVLTKKTQKRSIRLLMMILFPLARNARPYYIDDSQSTLPVISKNIYYRLIQTHKFATYEFDCII